MNHGSFAGDFDGLAGSLKGVVGWFFFLIIFDILIFGKVLTFECEVVVG